MTQYMAVSTATTECGLHKAHRIRREQRRTKRLLRHADTQCALMPIQMLQQQHRFRQRNANT